MGKKDVVTKDYMDNAEVFADAFNYFLFGGREVIDPLKLHTMDTTEIGMPYGQGNTITPVQKFRDDFKYLSAMEDETAAYLLLGIENQSEIHRAMAVKNMVYDALQYATQVEKAALSHRKAGKNKISGPEEETVQGARKSPKAAEYLSGFYKEDRLIPVITLVVLFSPEEWDAPMSLHEMFAITDKNLLSFVPDYKLNLIAPAQIDKEEMDKFKTSLREVLLYIKYSKDKKKLEELLKTDPSFKTVERKAAVVINTITNSKLKLDEKGEVIDMCQAIAELREEMKTEGIEQGIKQGIEQGTEQLGKLIAALIASGRVDDAQKAATDKQARDILYKEFNIL